MLEYLWSLAYYLAIGNISIESVKLSQCVVGLILDIF
jgi:hypothetical protein